MYGTEPDISNPRYNENVFQVPTSLYQGTTEFFVRRTKWMGKIHLVVFVRMY